MTSWTSEDGGSRKVRAASTDTYGVCPRGVDNNEIPVRV